MAGRAGSSSFPAASTSAGFSAPSTSTAICLAKCLSPLFLQLFALVSPLFFQVVIDKVLVSRTLSTLDVLVIGLVGIAIFETILGILRTYLFAHTTNRIDVELGARLFPSPAWRCRFSTFKHGASAIPSHACASSRTFEIFSPVRR